jgi:hypothetical protein
MESTTEKIMEKLAAHNFFQIDLIADFEFEGITYKDIKQRNNRSILTPENWEQHKETFFTQRMATYKSSYTFAEKMNLEFSKLEKLPINETDYQILKGRYKTYLEHKLDLPPELIESETDKLKVNQVALIYVYEGLLITRENAGEIAAKYGYTAKTSGEGLFQDFTYYSSTANRKGKPTPCTFKKLKNKIELFESIVNHLSKNSKQRAIDDINILRTILENEFQ